ncbi:hypothetical protein ACET3Z_000762 [Daucus carota]
MKKKEIPVNQIFRENLLYIVDEKAPEVHMNPFTIFYRMKSAENSEKFGTINLNETKVTVSEAVMSRTKDVVMEPTVNEAVVTTGETENLVADPMEVEVAVNTETEATVNEGNPT